MTGTSPSAESAVIAKTFDHLLKTYNPQPVILDRGEGAYLFDTNGKRYLDFAAGIAVVSLGHAAPVVLKTIQEQAEKLMMCQASFVTEPKRAATELLVENTCFDRIFFCNSGTEAMEAALKTVRKWAHAEKGPECYEIIAFRNSFHGRTYGAASITEKRLSQTYFDPYLPGVHFATFNDLGSVKKLVSKKTCAIVVEPVQGEGGLASATPQFLRGLRNICDTENIALVFDEVQCGMGRIGYFNAYEAFVCCPECVEGKEGGIATPVEPDLAAWAKGMGSGFPVGAMGAKEKFGKVIEPGDHGTTYGGNPLATAVAHAVMRELLKPELLNNVKAVGDFFKKGLEDMQRRSNKIVSVRGMGLMVGVDTAIDIKKLLPALQKNGLLATQAGKETLRLTPPLIINQQHAAQALDIIEKTLSELD